MGVLSFPREWLASFVQVCRILACTSSAQPGLSGDGRAPRPCNTAQYGPAAVLRPAFLDFLAVLPRVRAATHPRHHQLTVFLQRRAHAIHQSGGVHRPRCNRTEACKAPVTRGSWSCILQLSVQPGAACLFFGCPACIVRGKDTIFTLTLANANHNLRKWPRLGRGQRTVSNQKKRSYPSASQRPRYFGWIGGQGLCTSQLAIPSPSGMI